MDAVIVMAGKGTRLNAGMNKVLLDLNGKPVFKYSLDLFKKYADNIILVINPDDESFILPYLDDKVEITYGGSERYFSVLNGLKLTRSDKVLIHDAARPNVNPLALEKLIAFSNDYDALMLTQSEKNTTYILSDEKIQSLNREKIILASTPQIVNRNLYLKAVNKAIEDDFKPTDDISLMLNYDPKLEVKCIYDENNFKITTKLELELARMVIKNV